MTKIIPKTNLELSIKALVTYGVPNEVIKDMLNNLNIVANKKNTNNINMCSSCKHWQKSVRRDIGKCMISKIGHPMMHSGCGIYTREDFGCNLFQNFKKKET